MTKLRFAKMGDFVGGNQSINDENVFVVGSTRKKNNSGKYIFMSSEGCAKQRNLIKIFVIHNSH
jgi:hypothetical protein